MLNKRVIGQNIILEEATSLNELRWQSAFNL